MGSQIKAGVIGLGLLGREHVSLFDELEATEVSAVADLLPEVCGEVAEGVGAKPYTDYAVMLKEQSLDLVVVATPDWAHREPSLAAIEAGVPAVFSEKPMATSVEDAQAIADAVERHKTRFFINFSNRGAPMSAATHYVIQEGLLGEAIHGDVRLDDNITVPTQLWGSGSKEWAAGSSPIHFLISHGVDLVRWYFAPAEITRVHALTHQKVWGHTPEVADAFLYFDSGSTIRMKTEWIKRMEELVEFYLSFSGSEGTVIHNRRPGFSTQEGWRANLSEAIDDTTLRTHQDALKALGANVSALWLRPSPKIGFLSSGEAQTLPALESRQSNVGDMKELARAVVAALLESADEPECWKGNGPLPNHIDGLKQTRVCCAVEESGRTGQPVEL